MSLLLDALKRAEQEKLTRQGDRPSEAPPVRHAPAPAASALELQPIGGMEPNAGPAGHSRGDAQAAQALFQAKGGQEPRSNRGALWAIVGAIIVVVLAASAYVWYSLQSLAPNRITVARAHPTPIAPPAADLKAPNPESMGASAGSPSGPAPASNGLAAEPQAKMPEPPAAAAIGSNKVNGKNAAAAVLDRLLEEQPPASPGLRLEPSVDPLRTPADLARGYDALVAGDLVAARRHYAAALAGDDRSVDAQLGMATIEAREGHVAAAVARYRRALDLDAQNATALAGLAALAGDAHPEAVETQLRADLARHPDSAALHVALGNLYASQGRWSESQDAYFEAYRLQPGNADVLFNLAVSLDHLGQPRLAAEFYRRALAGAEAHPAQFDAALAARRLAQLRR